MTKEQILEAVKENLYNPYQDLKKAKESNYYVSCVADEIGRVAFFNDYELTNKELDELVESYFN